MSSVSSLSLSNNPVGSSSLIPTAKSLADAAKAAKAEETAKALSAVSNGASSSFLGVTDTSPVEKMLTAKNAQTTKAEKDNYFYSEDYLRLQANEIHARITTYKNLGLTSQYTQAQDEGQVVVQEYQALQKATAAGTDPVAAIKAVQKAAQASSFAVAPSILMTA